MPVKATLMLVEVEPLHKFCVPEITDVGLGYTLKDAVLLAFGFAQPTEVMVMVVEPLVANAAVENVPIPGLPEVKLIDADCAVATFAPLRL